MDTCPRAGTARRALLAALFAGALLLAAGAPRAELDISQRPLFLATEGQPLNMLVMGRDHKLYYEAYNDASDLDGDGTLDVGYKPDTIDYFGYFDSHKCYAYDSGDGRFEPAAVASGKRCSAIDSHWSGDFLNYLTTSRMDALRKVLYGGRRSTDSATETVLERSHIPQDAHSWGKEYRSIDHDGYDIREFSPLDLPSNDARHLFASTTLLDGGGAPVLRVLQHSSYRIWEWVSIERPVAGSQCNDGSGKSDCASDSTTYPDSPNDHNEFDAMVTRFGTDSRRYGEQSVNQIDGSGNPFGADDHFLTVFRGKLHISESGNYRFAVDGDDAIEVIIDGQVVAGWYGQHAPCNCQDFEDSIALGVGEHDIEYRHHERTGTDRYVLHWLPPGEKKKNWTVVPSGQFSALRQAVYDLTIPPSTLTDYTVRVQACVAGLLEPGCRGYPSDAPTVYKPGGLLQEYGESDRMAFGLLTGSHAKNTSGGVLRSPVHSLTDEIDADTGQFSTAVGIIDTIERLQTVNFGGNHQYDCGWITLRPINEGECEMWGNPIAEMLYETVRYFAGRASPTADFSVSDDAGLGLSTATWDDPYDSYPQCARPFATVISDINPSYDTDQLPGSRFGSFSGDLPGLDVAALADAIWDGEFGAGTSSQHYIGHQGADNDGAPTAKTVSSFSDIRGLAPEEPTKQGGYYSASVAYHGLTGDLHDSPGRQYLNTFAVALASPLPRIEIPVAGQTVTLVPFAKTIGGNCGGIDNPSATKNEFQPTDTIVDFYVESLSATQGVFQINYEDVEQGADHDMDAIVRYTYTVNADDTVTVELDSDYAAGCLIHHLGYVISGTTADGVYLEVRDVDTAEAADIDYFLDTPPGQTPGTGWSDGVALPLAASRTFTPGNTAAATLLKDPLWYAAKWGGFIDTNDNNLPDQQSEWDADADDTPDNYFLVTNAGKLKEQLDAAFAEIIERTSSAASVSTNSSRLDTDTRIYQTRFNSGDWSGDLLAYAIKADGSVGSVQWRASNLLPGHASRSIYTHNIEDNPTAPGVSFDWDNLSAAQQAELLADMPAVAGEVIVDYLRGSDAAEIDQGGLFRNRVEVIGDIVNSDPLFVGRQDFGYSVLPGSEGSAYDTFRGVAPYASRPEMVYVGANDGLLHAFDANTGVEHFAYLPGALLSRVNALTRPNYVHRYLLDGSPVFGDAWVNLGSGNSWHTLLVGTLGAGGRGLFALDVTNPANFVAGDVLWEFTADDDADLGFTMSQASLVRAASGAWVVVAGNGYNSDNHHAVLFILDAADGSLIRKIDTGVGSAGVPNGLSTPATVDLNQDRITDVAYAGDLHGNLWKFDLSDPDPANWDIAYDDASTSQLLLPAIDGLGDWLGDSSTARQPLFAAADALGDAQPVTTRPEVTTHPDGGVMVLFGTGRYFDESDRLVPDTPQVQSFYGIHDQGSAVTDGRTALLEQAILSEFVAFADVRVRVSTQRQPQPSDDGWYIDLPEAGERQVSLPILRRGRVVFTTLTPSGDPCDFGGTSWLMELNAITGGRLDYTPFDNNLDGYFDSADFVTVEVDEDGDGTPETVTVPISGRQSKDGIIKTPGIISAGTREYKYASGTSGSVEMTIEAGITGGRQSWRQIH